MLRTKSIKAPKEPEDGLRISVMSRHTLDDGVTPDPEIRDDSFVQWWVNVAPLPALVGKYLKGIMSWEEYEKEYLLFLRDNNRQTILRDLIAGAKRRNITMLCAEASPEHCHRRLLAEECKRLDPTLTIKIT